MKRYHAVLLVLAILIALALAGRSDYESETIEFRRYCHMIELHRQSGGELGWPDYRGLMDNCKQEK